ncbi:MAG: DUF1566 domain-containing protein [Bacteroidales bacterium]|nr:DUF1566 domain-containing protein [Bacteroidales bacterium]
MITGTVEGNQARFYIDGVLQTEKTLSNSFTYSNSEPLTLGMHYYSGVPSSWAYPLLGILDEVRIYNRAFTPQEVLMLYGDNVIEITATPNPAEGGIAGIGELYGFEDQQIPSGWTNDTVYPWVVTTPAYTGYNGSFCMRSGNGGVHSSTSSIEFTVDLVEDGIFSFRAGCWGEGTSTIWDKCKFFIDDNEQFNYGALQSWNSYSYEVTAGTHTFRWSYSKDSSVHPTGDAFFVDDVSFTGVSDGTYYYGQTCTMFAKPNIGYSFVGWTKNGTQVSTDPVYAFIVTESADYVAHFQIPNFTITAEANPAGAGTIIGAGDFNYGTICTLTATPNEGYLFLNWSKNGEVVSYNTSYTFTVTEDAELEAVFMLLEGTIIGSGETTNNYYLPSYSYYKYTLSQQIYTPDEIGATGCINSISFFNEGGTKTRNYDIYMVHTEKTVFDSNTDWITVSGADLVFSGEVTMTQGYLTTIVLDMPFTYNGTSNLAIVVDDNSGNYTGSPYMACRVFSTEGNQAIRVYSDGTNYDPFNPSGYNGTLHSVKNQIVLGFCSTCHFITAGNWSTASNWSNGALPSANNEVFIDASCQLDMNATVAALNVSDGQSLTLQPGKILNVRGSLINTATTGLIIEDGAQLVHSSENVSATVKKSIPGHGTDRGKYTLISNPLAITVNPELASIYHLTRGNYDLYDWLANAPDHLEWRNFKDDSFMMYPEGYGYLYANQNGMELNFPGTLLPSKYRFGKTVSYDVNDTEHPGWNLIGNPFVCDACLVNANNEPLPYYRMNAAGNALESITSGVLAPMEGVFYQASESGTVYFIRTDNTSQIPTFVISVSANPSDGGTVSGGGTYRQGQSCTVTAIASTGYTFTNWTEGGTVVSYNASYSFAVNGNRTLVANFHAYVDLGLPSGLLWATCNVGAESPEDYGDYFAWGETEPKDTYNWSIYQYCMGSQNTLTKYCSKAGYGYNGFTDNLTMLLPEDDVATASWGNDWRMPTKEEFEELYNNTTVTWTTQNGVNGHLFTASNGNSLFLPAAGYRNESSLGAGSYGGYWSSSLNTNYPNNAWGFYFSSGNYYMGYNYRDYGQSIRAVREN